MGAPFYFNANEVKKMAVVPNLPYTEWADIQILDVSWTNIKIGYRYKMCHKNKTVNANSLIFSHKVTNGYIIYKMF